MNLPGENPKIFLMRNVQILEQICFSFNVVGRGFYNSCCQLNAEPFSVLCFSNETYLTNLEIEFMKEVM